MTVTRTQFDQYQQSVLARRQSRYLDYPAHIHMETLSLCPAACSFCPYPTLERQGTRMPDELIAKILNDLQDIPQDLPFQLSPFKVNEPFLDNRLFDILRDINRQLPQASITLTSNAAPITPSKLAELATIQNLGYLWISLNEYQPEAYTKTMQLPWERTVERLTMIHQALMSGQLAIKVVLSRVGDGTPEDTRFCEWVKQTFPLFQVSVFQRGGWLGQVDNLVLGDVPNVGCIRWFDLSITSTGVVAHCCMDGKAQWPIGNVWEQHVLDIYNDPQYRRLRESTLSRHEVSPCNTCTFL